MNKEPLRRLFERKIMEKKPFSQIWQNKNARRIFLVALNTVLFYMVYRTLLYYAEMTDETVWSALVMALYGALLLGFVLAYLIYNRFLYRRGVTAEQLPDTMTDEEKQAFIEDGKARLEKSKWMMVVILPLVLVFLLDAVQLFIWEPFFK